MMDLEKYEYLVALLNKLLDKLDSQAKEIKELKALNQKLASQPFFTASEKETLLRQVKRIHEITHPNARAVKTKQDRIEECKLYIKNKQYTPRKPKA
jgi:hypothetical protein